MSRSVSLCLLILFAATAVQAILPPDASEREPEIRAARIRNRKEYDKRIELRRQEAVLAYKRVKAEMRIPPWERARAPDGSPETVRRTAGTDASAVKKEKKPRLLVSIMLLILIGSAVGWVTIATRKKMN